MTEIMLRDAGAAHGLRYMMLRYFNVADEIAGSNPSRELYELARRAAEAQN